MWFFFLSGMGRVFCFGFFCVLVLLWFFCLGGGMFFFVLFFSGDLSGEGVRGVLLFDEV